MPRISDERRRAVRAHIHDSAMRVAMSKGIPNIAMSDVIAESGMSAGAIYTHFTNKAELVGALATTLLSGRREALERLLARSPLPSPAEMLREMLEDLPEDVVDSGLLLQVWSAAASDPGLLDVAQHSFRTLQDEMEQYLLAWLLQEGVEQGLATTQARRITPAFTGLAQGYLVHRAVLGKRVAQLYLDSVDALVASV